jgi:hypothetical protein
MLVKVYNSEDVLKLSLLAISPKMAISEAPQREDAGLSTGASEALKFVCACRMARPDG